MALRVFLVQRMCFVSIRPWKVEMRQMKQRE